MQYALIDLDKVKFAAYNPRQITLQEMNKLKESLVQFGCVRPLVINKTTGNLIQGHQMTEAARLLGWKQLPYIEIELDEAREKVLNLALNRIAGDWDDDKLTSLLSEINNLNLNGLTGFDDAEIKNLLNFTDRPMKLEEVNLEGLQKQRYCLTFYFDKLTDYKKVFKHFKGPTIELDTKKLLKILK